MIDKRGFRANVGIVLTNDRGQLFWGQRIGHQNAWQFPQGGVNLNESIEDAMFRELHEELGLTRDDVEILAVTRHWLSYLLPKQYRRYHSRPLCIGQKQRWFLLKLVSDESNIHFDETSSPEFDHWKWVDYWHPFLEVIDFKRQIYKDVLQEFEPLIYRG